MVATLQSFTNYINYQMMPKYTNVPVFNHLLLSCGYLSKSFELENSTTK